MSASAVGRQVVRFGTESLTAQGKTRTSAEIAAGRTDGPKTPEQTRKDALAAIQDAIPAEGFATYLGIYGLVIALIVDANGKPLAWAAYGAVAVGAAINILSLLWAAGLEWKAKPPTDKRGTVLRLAWRVIAFTILYCVVVIATPDNPFAKFADLNIGIGLIAVVITGAIVAITKKP